MTLHLANPEVTGPWVQLDPVRRLPIDAHVKQLCRKVPAHLLCAGDTPACNPLCLPCALRDHSATAPAQKDRGGLWPELDLVRFLCLLSRRPGQQAPWGDRCGDVSVRLHIPGLVRPAWMKQLIYCIDPERLPGAGIMRPSGLLSLLCLGFQGLSLGARTILC